MWGQLVQGTLATSVGGSAHANDDQDGAYGWASIDDHRINTNKRLDRGCGVLRRRQDRSMRRRRLSCVCGWRWGGGSTAFAGWPSRTTSGSLRLSMRGARSGCFGSSCWGCGTGRCRMGSGDGGRRQGGRGGEWRRCMVRVVGVCREWLTMIGSHYAGVNLSPLIVLGYVLPLTQA